MPSQSLIEFVFLLLPIAAGLYVLWRESRRTAGDVLADLEIGEGASAGHGSTSSTQQELRGLVFDDELAAAGLFGFQERNSYRMKARMIVVFSVFITILATIIFGDPKPQNLVVATIVSCALGYIIGRIRLSARRADFQQQITFFLPVLMERIVMAVESGLDIVPAVKVAMGESTEGMPDPVSRLLGIAYRLAQAGVGFERSLHEVAERIDSRPLRHAFVHLAIAQREGGELVMPLRELSDATQLYFQESIEERIATMPARATLPLLCAFAGLVICFLTSPFLQVLGMMERSMPK